LILFFIIILISYCLLFIFEVFRFVIYFLIIIFIYFISIFHYFINFVGIIELILLQILIKFRVLNFIWLIP